MAIRQTVREMAEAAVDDLIKDHSLKIFKTTYDQRWVSVVEDGRVQTYQLSSPHWELYLERYRKHHAPWISEDLQEKMNWLLNVRAERLEGQTSNIRVARTDKSIQIDLMNKNSDAVLISNSRDSYTIGQPKDAFFIRSAKQLSLPRPIPVTAKEFIKLFKSLVPKLVSGHWLLALAFVLQALARGSGIFAILFIKGSQGSGKTTFFRRLKALIDPCDPADLSAPKSDDDIIVATQHSYLIAYDNLSELNKETANRISRLATGGGFSKRKLFTDHDELIYKVHNPVAINGMHELSDCPDFIARCVVLELEPTLDRRLSATELNSKFSADQPKLLHGLYTLLASCLRILPNIKEDSLPFLTDYALMGIAIERALGLKDGLFLSIYKSSVDNRIEKEFQSNELCRAVYAKLKESVNGRIEGSAHELRDILFGENASDMSTAHKGKIFSESLKSAEPMLKMKSITVERPARLANRRTIIIRFEAPAPTKKDWEWL